MTHTSQMNALGAEGAAGTNTRCCDGYILKRFIFRGHDKKVAVFK